MSTFVAADSSRAEFAERKNRILSLIQDTRSFYERNGKTEEARVFASIHENLVDGDFSIVMIGEFSSGKSTLLNALMGERILPSFTSETTATVNFLRHRSRSKDHSEGCVYYSDGTTQLLHDTSLETIAKYVSTVDKNVSGNVKHLDLYLDSAFLEDGVTLVDSPGLNGIKKGHKEITEQQILKSHASIFVFSSDHPGSRTDFEMLHELKKKVKTILFVLNKIDAIREEENETKESVIETLKKNYKSQFPEESTIPEIWPVAAFPALVARSGQSLSYHERSDYTPEEKRKLEEKSLLSGFENRLMHFLTRGEKAKAQLKAPVEKVIALLLETREKLLEEMSLIERSESSEELQGQIRMLEKSIEDLGSQISSTKMKIVNHVTDHFKEVREELASRIIRLKEKKLEDIDNFEDLQDLTLYLEKFEEDYLRKTQIIGGEIESEMVEKIADLINLEYSAHAASLEEKFAKVEGGMHISLTHHLEREEKPFEVGLEKMKEKEDSLSHRIRELKVQSDQVEHRYFTEMEKAEQGKQLLKKIERMESKKDSVDDIPLPGVDRYTEQVYEKQDRGGILGGLGWVFKGSKLVQVDKYVTDDSNLKRDLDRRGKIVEDCDAKIRQLEKELKSLGKENVRLMEKKRLDVEAELEEAMRTLREEQENNKEFMKSRKNQEMTYLRRKLRDFCDDASDEISRELKKYLQKRKRDYVDLILEEIESRLTEKMTSEKEEMKSLQGKLDASLSEKEEILKGMKDILAEIDVIFDEALLLDAELYSMDVDEIQHISI